MFGPNFSYLIFEAVHFRGIRGPAEMRGNDLEETKVVPLIFKQFWSRSHLNKLDRLTPQDVYYLWTSTAMDHSGLEMWIRKENVHHIRYNEKRNNLPLIKIIMPKEALWVLEPYYGFKVLHQKPPSFSTTSERAFWVTILYILKKWQNYTKTKSFL